MIVSCIVCGKDFTQKTSTHVTCSKECRGVAKIPLPKMRTDYTKSKPKQIPKKVHKWYKSSKLAQVVKHALIVAQTKEKGYTWCERCGMTCYTLEGHHIFYRSECPSHKHLHTKRNMILLCRDCHEWYHEDKDNRNATVIERKLWEIFP